MRLTTKGRYAVTAMLDLALHEDFGPVSPHGYLQAPGDIVILPGTVVPAFA